MKTKKKNCKGGCKGGYRRYSKTCSKRKSCSSKQRGGAMCSTGLCGVGAAKISSLLAAGTFGGYKVFSMGSSMKTKKKGKKNKLTRHQKFKYIDNSGRKIDFVIRQKDKKITIKNGKKKTEKIYKTMKSATNRYERKLKECVKKGFDKC